MPVRTIPKNYRHLTGQLRSLKIGRSVAFESPLERDAFLLFDFDPGVTAFDEQPVRVEYTDPEGCARTYTPDVLVTLSPQPGAALDRRPVLAEVKSISDLREHGREFAARFRAARQLAKERDWRFHVLTEREIRSPLTTNVLFLSRFAGSGIRDAEVLDRVRDAVAGGAHPTVGALLDALSDDVALDVATDALWHLVAMRQVFVDLSVPLTVASQLLPMESASRLHDAIAAQLGLVPRGRQSRAPEEPPPRRIRYDEPDLSFEPGRQVLWREETVTIVSLVDLHHIIVRHAKGRYDVASPEDLAPVRDSTVTIRPELTTVDDAAWRRAVVRLEAIRKLLAHARCSRKMVASVARAQSVSVSTVYRWRYAARQRGIVGLLDPAKTGGRGQPRMDARRNNIVLEIITRDYLGESRRSIPDVIDAIEKRCKAERIRAPHANTIRNRIRALPLSIIAATRDKGRRPRNEGQARPGHFPHADGPLSVIQIDHALADLILVDDKHRLPIGRPWITVAIDVWSRVVLGLAIMLDAPSTLSVGLCLHHALFPKDAWLRSLGLAADAWPFYGPFGAVHADNAKEFRGLMLQRAAETHGFRIEWRPVKTPEYGAHIERYMGTVQGQMKLQPGATESDVKKRDRRQAEKSAALTLGEYTRQLTRWITGKYHHEKHAELGMPPIERWKQGLAPSAHGPGIGLPPRLGNADRILLDFLPVASRSIRPDGIELEKLRYFDTTLRPFIALRSASQPSPQYTVRYDPRDMSRVYLLDPQTQDYLVIPQADRGRPAASLFEIRAAQREVAGRGEDDTHIDIVYDTIDELRREADAATQRTAKARRAQQRRRTHRAASVTTATEERPPSLRVSTPASEADDAVRPLIVDDDALEWMS